MDYVGVVASCFCSVLYEFNVCVRDQSRGRI